VEKKIDRDFWSKQGHFTFAKRHIDAQVPPKRDYMTLEIEKMYAKLKELMGRKGKMHKIAWPVSLILATKK
jgi:hypothetical protein